MYGRYSDNCQKYVQPFSPAVSCANESYNMNSPTTSLATVVSSYSYTCVRVLAATTIQGWHLSCSEFLTAWHLFEEIQ